jgi:hypothetical protein
MFQPSTETVQAHKAYRKHIISVALVYETVSVVSWSDFLPQIQRLRVRFRSLSDILRMSGSGTGPIILVRITEELLEWEVAAPV